MGSDLNTLIDACDRLEGCASPDALWQSGRDLFASIGSDCATVGSSSLGSYSAPLVRTSLPSSLMNSYISEQIHLRDPWMAHCAGSNETVTLDVTRKLSTQSLDVQARQCELFESHGISTVNLFPCGGAGWVGGVVLYAMDAESALQFARPHSQGLARLLVALFSAKYRPQDETLSPGSLYPLAPRMAQREREVLQWLAQGYKTARIAEKMGIEPVTVSKHLASARRKLGARTSAQALVIAMQNGAVSL